MSEMPASASILIVDDNETNIEILIDALSGQYEISVATDGLAALNFVAKTEPDLILLDIMMPELDGYEVCRRLKADNRTRDIPVIFLTALSDVNNEELGLSIGAIDYITKPITPAIVRARVKNHLALRQSQKELQRQLDANEDAFQKLRELETLRNDLVHMIVHDMRSPLMAVHGNLELTLMVGTELNTECKEFIHRSMETTRVVMGMATQLLDISRLESNQMPLNPEPCDLAECVKNAVREFDSMLAGRQITLVESRDPVSASCDPVIIKRIIQNLLANAIKFTKAETGRIRVALTNEGQWAHLAINDNGPGIPVEYREKIFSKFGQVEARRNLNSFSSGLGLAFCKLAVEALGGSIAVESELEIGSTFHVRIPIAEATSPNEELKPSPEEGVADSSSAAGIVDQRFLVMLVDDDHSATESLRRYLEKKTAWNVYAINNPHRAMRAALELKPDLLVLDIDMPEVQGPEIVKELEFRPGMQKTKMIYCTGLIGPEEIARQNELGKSSRAIIAKGAPLKKILEELAHALESSSVPD